jgi:hypothetical protein
VPAYTLAHTHSTHYVTPLLPASGLLHARASRFTRLTEPSRGAKHSERNFDFNPRPVFDPAVRSPGSAPSLCFVEFESYLGDETEALTTRGRGTRMTVYPGREQSIVARHRISHRISVNS